jgi:hypothetical protein
MQYLTSNGYSCTSGAALHARRIPDKTNIWFSGFVLLGNGDRKAAMAALMSCSVFVCIVSAADLGPDELQNECTQAI